MGVIGYRAGQGRFRVADGHSEPALPLRVIRNGSTMIAQVPTTRSPRVREHPRAARKRAVLAAVVLVSLGSAACASGSNPVPPVPTVGSPPQGHAPAPPGIVSVPEGQVAKVFADPSLSSAVLTTLPRGSAVAIICTAHGEKVGISGRSSSIWDKTQYGYLPAAYVHTGTRQAAPPGCS